MAFYTIEWIKQLIKEDHDNVQKVINSKDKDLRSYIDATLPFTLYLDISNIRKEILSPNAKFIQDLAQLINTDPNILIKALDDTYKKLINSYIDRFPTISSEELSRKLSEIDLAVSSGSGIKSVISKEFSNTFSVSNLSKRNKSVLLVFPRFRTISDRFGNDFREQFDYSKFSDYIDDSIGGSPQAMLKNYMAKNFGVLQNIGHVEIDVMSTEKGSSEVKRGLVSPRLIQALLELPKGTKPANLARTFSKDTGQANTRIIVRKKFNSTKLVLEMLIEHGMMIGSLESQKTNLDKAKLEKKFPIGANLTARLIKNKDLLKSLVTSKSITQYLADCIADLIKTGKSTTYSSSTTITKTSKVQITKVTVPIKNTNNSSSLIRLPGNKSLPSVSNLQALISARLAEQIKRNMGAGNDKKVLNYRTGRLAESATVERLSQSREGMVSVFYNYMRNPYGTFSAGGAQQNPISRDPKTLISKSIREIGASLVGNRMRAILV